MNDNGECFFAHTAFTHDQYGEICIGDLCGYLQRIVKGRRVAYDPEPVFYYLNVHSYFFDLNSAISIMVKDMSVPAETIPAATLSFPTAIAAAITPKARKKYFASIFISVYFT